MPRTAVGYLAAAAAEGPATKATIFRQEPLRGHDVGDTRIDVLAASFLAAVDRNAVLAGRRIIPGKAPQWRKFEKVMRLRESFHAEPRTLSLWARPLNEL